MASNTNNNVNPLSMALSNSMPGAKPFGSSTGGYGNQTSTSSYAPSSSPSQAGPSVPNASAFSRFTGSPGGLMAQALAPSAPTSQAVKSHVVSPDGTVQQTYYDNSTGLLTKAGVAAGKPQVNAPKATQPAQQTAANGSTSLTGQSNQPPVYHAISDSQGNEQGSYQYDIAHGLPAGSSSILGYQPPNSSSYSSLQSDLANQQNSPYNQEAQSAIGSINSTAGQNAVLGQNAQQIANTAGEDIKNTGVYGQNAGIGYQTAGGDQGFGLGGANAMANAASGRQQAIVAKENADLAGNQQALSALGQQGSQYGQAAGIAQTGQSQAQSALGLAAGLAAPILGSYGQNNYNPVGGNPSGGVTGVPAQDISTLSQAVNSGTMSYSQALSQLGGYGTYIQNQLLPSIQKLNPSFNVNTSGGNAQTQEDFAKQYNQGTATLKTADGIQNQIVNTLKSNPGLNSIPASSITNLSEILSGQISSGPQQLLSQQVSSYINTLGLDPASVAKIAFQQKGTLAQLLDSLRTTYQTQNEAHNPSTLSTGSSSSSGGSAANPWH